jgi:hypothetical protein
LKTLPFVIGKVGIWLGQISGVGQKKDSFDNLPSQFFTLIFYSFLLKKIKLKKSFLRKNLKISPFSTPK